MVRPERRVQGASDNRIAAEAGMQTRTSTRRLDEAAEIQQELGGAGVV